MQVLFFLLDLAFYILVALLLLRAWMNGLGVRMTQQPGLFAMAMTDWIVKPLRRTLPRELAQSAFDLASLIAALLMALAYAGLMHGLTGRGPGAGWLISLPVLALWFVLRSALQLAMLLALGYAILSWVQPMSPVYRTLGRLVEPLLRPIRRVVPMIGGVDLSVLVLVVLLQVGLMLTS